MSNRLLGSSATVLARPEAGSTRTTPPSSSAAHTDPPDRRQPQRLAAQLDRRRAGRCDRAHLVSLLLRRRGGPPVRSDGGQGHDHGGDDGRGDGGEGPALPPPVVDPVGEGGHRGGELHLLAVDLAVQVGAQLGVEVPAGHDDPSVVRARARSAREACDLTAPWLMPSAWAISASLMSR